MLDEETIFNIFLILSFLKYDGLTKNLGENNLLPIQKEEQQY